jgi:hypothetical protein
MESAIFDRSKSLPDQEHKPMPRIAFRPLVLIAALALMAVIVGAQAPVPQPEDQETAREVVDLVERNHMAHPQINDEIGEVVRQLHQAARPAEIPFLEVGRRRVPQGGPDPR